MKKFWLSVLILIASVTIAQAQLKPAKGDLGLGFKIQGLSDLSLSNFSADDFGLPQVLVRYYLSPKYSLRGQIGFSMANGESVYRNNFVDSISSSRATLKDSTIKTSRSSMNISFSPGIEYHLKSSAARLDPYIGAVIPFSFVGESVTEVDERITFYDFASEKTIFDKDVVTTTTEPGSILVGLNLLGGFNFFISDNIAVGAEYSLGFGMTSVGGDVTYKSAGTIQATSDATNVLTVDETTVIELSSSLMGGSLRSTGGINISIFW
jgi:hypothetical protein